MVALADERARRDRQRMLARVRKTWIAGVLDASLHGAALQALGLEERPEAVPDRWGLVVQEAREQPRPLPPGTPVADVFDAFDGELLLLGEPGAGKTTLLLELCRSLLDRAGRDEALPMPVVFPLSTWAAQRPPLAEWLVGELAERYDVPRAVGTAWVADEQILPLLDGLDEVRGRAPGGVRRGDQRLPRGPALRPGQPGRLQPERRLRGAGRPAGAARGGAPAAADARAGGRLPGQRRPPARGPAGGAAARRLPGGAGGVAAPAQSAGPDLPGRPGGVPAGGRQRRGPAGPAIRGLRRADVRPPGADPRHPKARTVRWLAWLAGAMTRQGQTVFYLERLQPEWLPTPALRRRYALTDRVGAGLGAGLVFGLLFGLVYGLLFGLGYGLLGAPAGELPGALAYGLPGALTAGLLGGSRETRFGDRWRLREIVRDASPAFLAVGLAGALAGALAGGLGVRWGNSLEWLVLKLSSALAGALAMTLSSALAGELPGALVFGLAGALAGALAGGPGVRPRHIAVVETLRWSFSHARSAAAVGLLSGLAGGVAVGLLYGLVYALAGALPGALSSGLAGGLAFGLLGGLVLGLVFGLAGALARGGVEDETKAVPNQGIHRSAWAAAAVGLAVGLLSGLGVGLVYGLLKGLPAGLAYGVGVGLASGWPPVSSSGATRASRTRRFASSSGAAARSRSTACASSTPLPTASSCVKSAGATSSSTGCCRSTSPHSGTPDGPPRRVPRPRCSSGSRSPRKGA